MPLPTWYRFIRTLPGVAFGCAALATGIYLITAPTSYRDPNNLKMVAYADQMHPVVIVIGVFATLAGAVLIYFGVTRYFRMPEYLREFTHEQLRLGQVLGREILRQTKETGTLHDQTVTYTDGSETRISAWRYANRSIWDRLGLYGFGGSVMFIRDQPPTEIDGVLHVPTVSFTIDTFTGKASRNEYVTEYQLEEQRPLIDPDSLLGEAVRIGVEDGELDEAQGELIESSIHRVLLPRRRQDDPVAHYKFMRQMGLDKPSAEELQRAIDELTEW